MLILNYLGQGAWILKNYEAVHSGGINPFFGVMPEWMLIPGIIIATAAAIIASQALITGSFTIFSEAMSLNFWPNQELDYPSGIKGQMYIPNINWGILFFCLLIVLHFQESGKMEAAYGLSITITMLMTTILLSFWLLKKRVSKIFILAFTLIYLSIEIGFFSANVIKFFEGGWITVVLAGFIGICMYSWYNGRMIKSKFIKFVNLKSYISIIKDMKLDKSIPKFATNLAFFSRAKNKNEVESKIIYSIMRSQPKRADHYFILNIINQEEPYTFQYSVDEVLPGTVFKVDFLLGFKVNRNINDYFQQVLQDLMENEIIPSHSPYPSLRDHHVPPDLKYVIIDNVYINEYLLTLREKIILKIYNFVKLIGTTDFKFYGVSSHNVVVESAPLLDLKNNREKIQQLNFKNFDS
jgi:KUP system potassium uptake protein